MSNLKPCPFCGGEAKVGSVTEELEEGCYYLVHSALCQDCELKGRDADSIQGAIYFWNNRHYEKKKLKEAFLAGMDCYEYVEKTGVPQEDAFDQWLEHREGWCL